MKPNSFPKNIFENVAAGKRVRVVRGAALIADSVVSALKRAALWDEVMDKFTPI